MDEMYVKYLEWSEGKPDIAKEDLFQMPITNEDVYENEMLLVNHLYFLIVKYDEGIARYFAFYEANTFMKEENGDLDLVYSTYCLP